MKKILIFILLLSLNIEICYSMEGGYAGSFLRMGLGARPKSLGGAFVAVADDPYASYYNPGGLPFLDKGFITFSAMFLSLDRKFNYVSFSQGIKPAGGFSIGWMNVGVGNIDMRNFEGEKIGDIDCSENAFYFSFAQILNRYISVGITCKILHQKLYRVTARGFGFDFGILVKPMKNVNVGFLVKDLNAGYAWNTDKIYDRGTVTDDKFPIETKIGTSYLVEKFNLLFAFDFEKNERSNTTFHMGIEKVWRDRFSLRSGINKSNLCFGGGLKFSFRGRVSFIDYSFENVEFDESPNQVLTLTLTL